MPFGAPKLRAVKEERKHYHFDWSLVPDKAARFENMVAAHLLKWVHFLFDTEGREVELRYFRDVDGREVDFVLVERKKPVMMVECKLADTRIHHGLRYLRVRFPAAQAYQVHLAGEREYLSEEHGWQHLKNQKL